LDVVVLEVVLVGEAVLKVVLEEAGLEAALIGVNKLEYFASLKTLPQAITHSIEHVKKNPVFALEI